MFAEVFYDTAAQSILPQVVSRRQLTRANGRLYAAELTANEFIGPPMGGVLVTIGAVAAFVAPAGLWLLAAGVLLLLQGPSVSAEKRGPDMRTDIVDGLRFLWHNTVLRTLTIMTGVFNLASSATMAILVVYAVGATSALGLTATQYGLLLTATAAGSVAGTLVAGTIERRLGRSRAMVAGLAAAVLFICSPVLSSNPLVIASGFFIGGAGIVLWNVIAVSLRQRITPDAVLGRVTGAHRLFAWGSKPLGAALGGLLAQAFGLEIVFVVMAVCGSGAARADAICHRRLDPLRREQRAHGTVTDSGWRYHVERNVVGHQTALDVGPRTLRQMPHRVDGPGIRRPPIVSELCTGVRHSARRGPGRSEPVGGC